MVTIHRSRSLAWGIALAAVVLTPERALAHCDALDGPVVKAAERALETRNPAPALVWVDEKDAPEIRSAFDQALEVRELSPQAKALADRFFFETLVRVHRAGEGAPFTGLQPAGRDLGPAIPAADEAVRVGSVEPARRLLMAAIQERLHEHFADLLARKAHESNDLSAGRAYVRAYVEFIHFVERVHEAAMKSPEAHVEHK